MLDKGIPEYIVDLDTAATHMTTLLSMCMGFDLTDPNLKGTPNRIINAWYEMTHGRFNTEARVAEELSVTFPSEYDEMIVERGIEVVSVCPHHFLPVEYTICIGYIPGSPDRQCVGLSKLVRAAEILAARPVLQEQLAKDISETIYKYLSPVGSGAILEARHGCMTCRGVKQRHLKVITSYLSGAFRESATTKAEFLAYYHNGG